MTIENKITFTNLRDLGGLKCTEGRAIKPNKIFRAPKLTPNNQTDIDYINSLNLNCVIDFRYSEEIKQSPDMKIRDCKYINDSLYDGSKYKYIIVSNRQRMRLMFLRGNNIEKLKKNKLDSYKEMPFSKSLLRIFECMDQGQTFLFHCTEGKDRTGIAAALIELALGRKETDIKREYLLSNELRPPKYRKELKYLGFPKALIDAIYYCEQTHEELFELAKKSILSKYPSVEEYFKQEFDITKDRINHWKDIYLE